MEKIEHQIQSIESSGAGADNHHSLSNSTFKQTLDLLQKSQEHLQTANDRLYKQLEVRRQTELEREAVWKQQLIDVQYLM
jgi:exonuclease VII small subunit